jgi:hypothetical protein
MRPLATILLLVLAGAAVAQVAVVHPRVTDSIDRDLLRNILLGRVTTWADGSQVVLVLSGDPASRAAIEDLTGRDLDRLIRGWKRILFSGNGAMPIVTSGANEAFTTTADRPGAIAITGTEPTDHRVRVAVQLEKTTPK